MEILDIITNAQGGAVPAQLGAAAGVDAETARAALERLVPDIARRIARKAENRDDYERLLDELDDSEADKYLDNSSALLSRAAARDGEDILEYLYGSLADARRQAASIGPPAGMNEATFGRLMTYAATLVLAAMIRRNKLLVAPAADFAAAPGSGIAASLIGAVIKGIVDGFKRAMLPRRRRTRLSTRHKSRRTRSRRGRTPSLQDILGDLVKDAVKSRSGR